MPKQSRAKNNADSVGREFALFKCGTPVDKIRRRQARSICVRLAQAKEGVRRQSRALRRNENKPREKPRLVWYTRQES